MVPSSRSSRTSLSNSCRTVKWNSPRYLSPSNSICYFGKKSSFSLQQEDDDESDTKDGPKKISTESFKIVFKFAENKYFKGTELTKTFVLTRDNVELSLVKTEGSKIEWNDKCDPSKKLVKKSGKYSLFFF